MPEPADRQLSDTIDHHCDPVQGPGLDRGSAFDDALYPETAPSEVERRP